VKLTNANLSHYFHNGNQYDVYINFVSFPERAAYMFTGSNLMVVVMVVMLEVVVVVVVVCGSASLQTIFRRWQITEYEYGTLV
jgi:hypothetical protein